MTQYRAIHVYDIDGVLVDTSHRYRNKPDGTIDLDYWLQNRTRENIARDKLLPLIKKYRRDLADPHIYVILCTARQDHELDREFFAKNLGNPNRIYMRPPGNNEPDGKLKRRVLSRLFNLKQFKHLPRFFWEDNLKNIAACETLFTRCFHIHSRITENAS